MEGNITDFFVIYFIEVLLKRPRTPPTNNPAVDYQTADSEHVLKRTRTFGISDEVCIFWLFFLCF